MKKILFALLLWPSFCLADGPKWSYPDVRGLDDEMNNIYHDIRRRAGTSSLDPLNISSATISSATIAALITQSINGTFIGLGRNRIINGEMNIDQANGGAAATVNAASDIKSLDQWVGFGQASSGVFTLQRLSATPPTGFTNYLRIATSTGVGTPGSGASYILYYKFEGYTVRDFLFGTANAVPITLSFWAKSSLTGTFAGAVSNSAESRTYVFNYTINSANTWEKKTISLPGDTSGTWSGMAASASEGMELIFDIGSGSGQEGTANTWNASAKFRASGNVRLISTVNATLDLAGVQLEVGQAATAFEYRPFQIELAFCQRYYEKSYELDTAPGASTTTNLMVVTGGQIAITTVEYTHVVFKVQKRSAPTIAFWLQDGTVGKWRTKSTAGVNSDQTMTADVQGTWGFAALETAVANIFAQGHWTADARL